MIKVRIFRDIHLDSPLGQHMNNQSENPNKLFDFLAEYGGSIVSTASLSPEWIEQARASGRMYVDNNSLGYVWEPDIKRIPETPQEVEAFEKWFPLPAEIPEHLKNPSFLFDKEHTAEGKWKKKQMEKYFEKRLPAHPVEEKEGLDKDEIIAEQDRMIGELTRKVNNLEDTESKRVQWLDKAKKEAGYDRMESFDNVWKEVLAKSKSALPAPDIKEKLQEGVRELLVELEEYFEGKSDVMEDNVPNKEMRFVLKVREVLKSIKQ